MSMSLQSLRSSLLPVSAGNAASLTSETRSVTARAREADLDLLERMFVLADRNAVRAFLAHRPFLVPLLFDSHSEIAKIFPGAPLRLAVVVDPEDENDRHLTLSIVASFQPDVAIKKLQVLDDSWWLDAIDRARCALSISITTDEL